MDGRAAVQQQLSGLPEIRETQARRGRGRQGAGPAREQADQQIPLRGGPGHLQHAAGGPHSGLVRHGMPGFGLANALQRQAVVILDHHKALVQTLAQHVFQSLGHGRDALSGTQYPHPAVRQVPAAAVGHKLAPARAVEAHMAQQRGIRSHSLQGRVKDMPQDFTLSFHALPVWTKRQRM